MWLTHFSTALLLTLIAFVGISQPVAPPVLIVLAVDASKSALPVPKPTISQIREIEALLLQRNNGGTLAFAVIGNPKPEMRHFYRFDLEPMPVAKPNVVLTVQARIRSQAKGVMTGNLQRSKEWEALYQQVVLQYKPNGPELSNVGDVFTKSAILLREIQYKGYRRILVFCSDLKNEPKRSTIVVPWSVNLNGIPQLTIIGTGASDPNPFTGLPNYIVLADVAGLVPAIKAILNQ